MSLTVHLGFLFLKTVITVSMMLLHNIEVAFYKNAYKLSKKLDYKVTFSYVIRGILLASKEN